jgi:hypothetical protein
MAVTNFSPLLGLALPTTGDLAGTWGTTVNDSITQLLDSAVAGTTTLSADADVTLSTTNGAANQARNAVILWTASNGATTRNITAPAQSKAYLVINSGTGSIVIRGAGPTTGVTLPAGARALVAWNGSDFVKIVSNPVVLTTDVTGTLPIANGGTNATTAPNARTSLGATTLGSNVFTITNPSAITFPRFNADNTVSALDAASFRTAIGAGVGGGDVSGPASSTTGAVPVYSDTTGKVLAGGVAPGTAGNVLTSNGTAWASTAPAASGASKGQAIAFSLIFGL